MTLTIYLSFPVLDLMHTTEGKLLGSIHHKWFLPREIVIREGGRERSLVKLRTWTVRKQEFLVSIEGCGE